LTRYDYNPYKKEFLVRMVSPFHEQMVADVIDSISAQLEKFRYDPRVRTVDLAARIRRAGSSDISLPDGSKNTKQPDCRYNHINCGVNCSVYPGLILEVSYSQRQKDLEGLAREYIQKSGGAIRTVVGIKIDYLAPKTTSSGLSGAGSGKFSVWRAGEPDARGKICVQQSQREVVSYSPISV
jgi:hypothetical protein